MQSMLMCVAAITTLGVDVGWQPTDNGELEYIIQISPDQLRNLKPGDVIEVGVRPQLRHVRRYKIIVGEGVLPRNAGGPNLMLEQPAIAAKPLETPSRRSLIQPPLDVKPELSVVVDSDAAAPIRVANEVTVATNDQPVANDQEAGAVPIEKPKAGLYVIPNYSAELRRELQDNNLLAPPPYPGSVNSATAENESSAIVQPPADSINLIPPADATGNDLAVPSYVPVPDRAPRTIDPNAPRLAPSDFTKGYTPPTHGEHLYGRDTAPAPHVQPPRESNPAYLDSSVNNNSQPEGTPAAFHTRPATMPVATANVLAPKDPPATSANSNPSADNTKADGEPATQEAPKSWALFSVTLLALFASIGGNLYLGWMNWDMRQRFRSLVRKFKLSESREERADRD